MTYVKSAPVEIPDPEKWSRPVNWRTGGDTAAVTKALEMLLKAKDPYSGRRGVLVSGAAQELSELANYLNIPVYASLMGKGAMSEEDPLYLGVAGCWGTYPAVEAARNADVILALGCRFSDLHTGSWLPGFTYNIPPTKLIQVDIDASEIGRNYPVEIGIIGDIKAVLCQMIEMAQKMTSRREEMPWHKEIEGFKRNGRSLLLPTWRARNSIDPRRVLGDINKIAPRDTILLSDVGNNQPWVGQTGIPASPTPI